MDPYALPLRPSGAAAPVEPEVDLSAHHVDTAGLPADPWEWCSDFVRRAVAGPDGDATRVDGDAIKGFDHTSGADHDQLGRVLAALDQGRPVACLGWWPSAVPPATTPTLGHDVVDVPPPDRKGTELGDGHSMVILGYARHDAFAGGGYLVVRLPDSADGSGRAGAAGAARASYVVPFTYVRAYATQLWTARAPGRAGADHHDRPPPQGSPRALPDDADREIRRRARCVDPSGSLTGLFFSERACDTLRAKAICSVCSVRVLCLQRALERCEPYGVWGGEFVLDGEIVAVKRGRGRPSRRPMPDRVDEITGAPLTPAVA